MMRVPWIQGDRFTDGFIGATKFACLEKNHGHQPVRKTVVGIARQDFFDMLPGFLRALEIYQGLRGDAMRERVFPLFGQPFQRRGQRAVPLPG